MFSRSEPFIFCSPVVTRIMAMASPEIKMSNNNAENKANPPCWLRFVVRTFPPTSTPFIGIGHGS